MDRRAASLSIGLGVLVHLGGASPATAAKVVVNVVDEEGTPVEAATIGLLSLQSPRERERAQMTVARVLKSEPRGEARRELSAGRAGPHVVYAWTSAGLLVETIEVGEEDAEVALVVAAAGSMKVSHKATAKDVKERGLLAADEGYAIELSVYRGGLLHASADLMARVGEECEVVFETLQPGEYTLIARSTLGSFCSVKERISVASGKSKGVKVPPGGGSLGGAMLTILDKKTKAPLEKVERALLLSDGSVQIRPAEQYSLIKGLPSYGWCDLTTGSYLVRLEAKGYEPLETKIRISAPKKGKKDMFGNAKKVYAKKKVYLVPKAAD